MIMALSSGADEDEEVFRLLKDQALNIRLHKSDISIKSKFFHWICRILSILGRSFNKAR